MTLEELISQIRNTLNILENQLETELIEIQQKQAYVVQMQQLLNSIEDGSVHSALFVPGSTVLDNNTATPVEPGITF